jgi:drug/metabolite transporter (DMT)-like permease
MSGTSSVAALGQSGWLLRYVACSMIWGSGFALIKIAVDAGVGAPWVGFWRCLLGAAVLWMLVALRRATVPTTARVLTHTLVVGTVLNAVPFSLFALAEQQISSVLAGVWNSTIPLFTLVFALAMLPDERPTVPRLVGLATGCVGALVVLGVWRGVDGDLFAGSLACLLATALYGLGYAYTRRFLADVRAFPITLVAMQLSWATAELTLAAPLLGGAPHWPGLRAALALLVLGAVGTGIAYAWNVSVIRAVGSTVASTVAYLTPLWAALVGVAFLHESLGWNTAIGALLIVSGVLLTRVSGSPRRFARLRRQLAVTSWGATRRPGE